MPIYRKTNRRAGKVRSSVKKRVNRDAYAPSTYFTRGTNPQNAVSFRGKGFPDRLTTNLVFCDSIILDPSAGTPMPFTNWRLNSLYDPNAQLGGGQPTYFDQLAIIYDNYIVNGCKITATFSRGSTTTANVGPYLCGIQCSELNSLPTTNPGGLMSAPNTISRLVSQDDGSVQIVSTYSKAKTFPDTYDALNANIGANPAQSWYAKVFAGPQGVDVDIPINVTIVMEFNATFSDVKQVVDA